MTIEGYYAVAVRDHAVVAVTRSAGVLALNRCAYIYDRTAVSCTDGGSVSCTVSCDINTGMESHITIDRMGPVAVRGSDVPAGNRPGQMP